MITIDVRRRVSAPIAAVWATVSAIDGYPEIVDSYVRVANLTEQSTGVGTRWRQTRRVFGREHAQELIVVAWEAPSLLVTVAREAGATYRTTWLLVPDGDATVMALRFEIGSTNLVGALVQRLFGGRLGASTREAMDRDFAEAYVALAKAQVLPGAEARATLASCTTPPTAQAPSPCPGPAACTISRSAPPIPGRASSRSSTRRR